VNNSFVKILEDVFTLNKAPLKRKEGCNMTLNKIFIGLICFLFVQGSAISTNEDFLEIESAFYYARVAAADEGPPREIASDCFRDIADAICNDPRWDCSLCN
jgi:hypothetical protein